MNIPRLLPGNHLARIVFATVLVLLVPLVAMQFNDDVNWRPNDFVVAGVLLFLAGLGVDLIFTKVRTRNRKAAALAVLAVAFLYLWAELAVGVFTHWGS